MGKIEMEKEISLTANKGEVLHLNFDGNVDSSSQPNHCLRSGPNAWLHLNPFECSNCNLHTRGHSAEVVTKAYFCLPS